MPLRTLSALVLLLPFTGCVPGKEGGPLDDLFDGEDEEEEPEPEPACTGVRFAAAPVEWALPDFCDERDDGDDPACRQVADNYVDRSGNTTYFSTFDLNGDGALDMVVTRDTETDEDTKVGREHWTWHPGGADGFGAAQAWALPDFCDERDDGDDPACRQIADNYVDRSGNTTYFSTFDITGDGLLDMVVTRDSEAGDDEVGREHWLVYKGECGE
jgi:hypothetical protein